MATRFEGRDLVGEEELAALYARIDAEAAARSLYEQLGELSSAERAVLELVAVDGLGVAEAALALGINPVTARVRSRTACLTSCGAWSLQAGHRARSVGGRGGFRVRRGGSRWPGPARFSSRSRRWPRSSSPGGVAPAYAVNRNDDGTVTVEISSLSDAAGLESKLRDASIRAVVQYLPPGKACKQPWPTATPGDHLAKGGGPEGTAIKDGVAHTEGHTRLTISRNLPADDAADHDPGGGPSEATGPSSIAITLAHGDVLPCEIVDAPAGSLPFGPPPGGARLHTERG